MLGQKVSKRRVKRSCLMRTYLDTSTAAYTARSISSLFPALFYCSNRTRNNACSAVLAQTFIGYRSNRHRFAATTQTKYIKHKAKQLEKRLFRLTYLGNIHPAGLNIRQLVYLHRNSLTENLWNIRRISAD